MGNTKTKLEIPNNPSYSQLYQLLSVAVNCIKADRQRITALEKQNADLLKRIEALEAVGVSVNANGQVVQTYTSK